MPLDFAADDSRTGFRLVRFELFNWGTFDKRVWVIQPGAENALLTGDIGSGKSTLVDGLTTLFIPAQRITYNKAAGADSRERSLLSYVLGYYKSAKDDERLSAKAVALRDRNTYSALLAEFHNQGYDQTITLAQVFWLRDNKNQPERFYLIADRSLSINNDLAGFGNDILDLRKRLRNMSGTQLFDTFPPYVAEFRRRLGIQNDKALDLFYQTVSMKSVGNLTDFVRNHMLEAPAYRERIEDIRRNFDNLNRAHNAVLKARHQIDKLQPLIAECDRYEQLNRKVAHLNRCRDALYVYFSWLKQQLLETRRVRLQQELDSLLDRLASQRQRVDDFQQQVTALRQHIDSSGGRRLDELQREIQRLNQERERKSQRAEEYRAYCAELDLIKTLAQAHFHENRAQAEQQQQALQQQREALEQTRVDVQVEAKELNQQYGALGQEIESLRLRESNIPALNLEIRSRLCQTLELEENALPFVGELLRVRPEDGEWEGAIERLLHNFGLSLLVPEASYNQVSRYVDRTHLRGRLVYFRVRDDIDKIKKLFHSKDDPRLLFRKLDIKPDSRFYAWLERELSQRFDYFCCDSLAEFQRQPKAITAQGQIKSGASRHEKDDRHRIDDRSRYVLGWSNKEKIKALQQQQQRIERAGLEKLQHAQRLQKQLNAMQRRRDVLRDLLKIGSFAEVDWQPLARQIETLKDEKRRIEQGSDVLRTLQARLEETEQQLADAQNRYQNNNEQRVRTEERLERVQEQLKSARETLANLTPEQRDTLFPQLEPMRAEALGDKQLTIENCERSQTEMREWLQPKINGEQGKCNRSAETIVRRMQAYKNDYPLETREADAAVDAAPEFRAMLRDLREQDLPRHEQRFKALLNEGTIQDIALFQNQLEKESRDISAKIAAINHSLKAIDYNPGTYIELVSDKSNDKEIREFQQDLRACLGDTLSGGEDELYTEHKFLQVKALIDRFNGREGLVDADKRWTQKVSDVRNWFEFSVSERWREDGGEREFYSDSAGKSGGQKEKLAYTILAAALAYQFGLKWGETRSRSFRFVMIDEAFGRGSDESARYGLELFKKLNLQLLIVTPLQKIHIIEDYVRSVHFVHNEEGRNSMLRNLSIDAYREERAQRANR